MSEKLITPKASQRASNSQTSANKTPNKTTKATKTTAQATAKATPKTTKNAKVTKQTQGEKSSLSLKSHFNQFLLLITLIIAILAFYFSWAGDDNKWQIESINKLQNENQLLQQELNQKLTHFEKQLEQVSLKATQNPTAIEALDKDLTAKLTNQLNLELSQLKESITKLGLNQQTGNKLKNATIKDFTQQLKSIQDKQVQLEQKNTDFQIQLTKLLNTKQNKTSKAILAISKLSNLQVHNWVLQINNQWLFENNKFTALNSLDALAETISLSKSPYKQTLLAKIKLDQQMIEKYKPPMIATDKIKSLKTWLTGLNLRSENKSSTGNQIEQSSWELVKQKFSNLFSIRKKQSADQLSMVETELGKNMVKQRMLLQAEQLGWAIHTQSSEVILYAMNDISTLIEQYAPEQLSAWQIKMINLMPASQMAKMPLSITEIDYVKHH